MKKHNDEVVTVLTQKLQACNDFLTATLNLKKAFEDDEAQAVTDLIKRREELIGLIDHLDHWIDRYRQADAFDANTATTGEMVKIAEELHERLRQIDSTNRECEVIAAGRYEALRKEMAIINRNEEALQGYAAHRQRIPKFLSIQT
ncbi:MAG: hypothetical protein NTZ24_11645 [Deltaproteobacteria bacterium]|nr:hypothetical protein [Deltaproteobacteria bacterium]